MSKQLCSILVAALMVSQSVSHPRHGYHEDGHGVAVVIERPEPISRPRPIEASDKTRTCPSGFNWQGKECTKQVLTQPDVRCPPGFNQPLDGSHNQCVKFVSKLLQCPPGYVRNDGLCVQNQEVDAEVVCPDDFAFGPDGRQCIRAVQLEPTPYCPNDTIRKGDICVKHISTPWELTCPPDFVLKGKRCYTEEMYDCTPEKMGPSVKPILAPVPTDGFYGHKKNLRYAGHLPEHIHHEGLPYRPVAVIPDGSKAPQPPRVYESIVETTCRRTRSEDAHKLCPPGSRLHGKGCLKEETVPVLLKPGGFREEFAPPVRRCPRNFAPGAFGRCFAQSEVPPELFCPANTENAGNKCAMYRNPFFVCPADYKLNNNNVCVKTVVAPPVVEYTVTFACTGKDCAD